MRDITEHARVRLSVVALVSILAAAFSGGVTWATLHGDIVALQDRASRAERRLDKVESSVEKVVPLIERIDERTAQIAARLDRSK